MHANSGATWRQKGDVGVQLVLRVEAKETDKKTYRLSLAELMKIESEAEGDELPVFSVMFKKTPDGVARRYAILPWKEVME